MLEDGNLELWGLFASAFIASTIAPGGSEGVLAWLVTHSSIPTPLLLATATVGNTLGALTTLSLGIYAEKGYSRIRVAEKQRLAAIARLHKWGASILLFSWLPVVGDALCFAAGWMRMPILRSTVAILIGKLFRYAVIVHLFA
ncbi:MAG: DedA family protein [Methylococcaceae bacterium]|nr:DedA family protein [Methylococcaceae bacterium]MCI0733096.1 DedA family protein [Methylococcaceae bacterium]